MLHVNYFSMRNYGIIEQLTLCGKLVKQRDALAVVEISPYKNLQTAQYREEAGE